MIEHTTPENEVISQISHLNNNVGDLSDICTETSQQLFIILRQLKHIELYLQAKDTGYVPFDEEKDEASNFINQLCSEDISVDDLNIDKSKLQ